MRKLCVGAVEPGKFADHCRWCDSIADISALERIRFVMKEAQLVRNELGQP